MSEPEEAASAGERRLSPVIAELEQKWRERRSMRAFRPEPLAREELVAMFAAAQHAPSWCNTQPWRVAITEPPKTAALAAAMVASAKSELPHSEVPFPGDYPPPYKAHRVACGVALYKSMGIARDDGPGRYEAWLRNYMFFDAPHVAIVACDRRLGPYVYVDVGVWLGYLLTAAVARGIDTCPMASVATYPETLRKHLPIADSDVILFGVALGRADETAPANRTRTTREPVAANVTFCA